MNNRKNLISALIYQIVLLIYGLVVPRIIISTFGSATNGLVSSITQFLSFISLLEGGLGAVVLAELYRPIEINDTKKIKGILLACQRFFEKISVWFIVYSVIIAISFSVMMREEHTWMYTASLVFILSIITLAQYLFSITNKLFLQASQKIYIVNNVISVSLIVNVFLVVIVARFFPEIHVLKLASSVSFFIQPIVFSLFVEPEYRVKNRSNVQSINLKNRWSGFAQNLAHFVNMNTDVALITIFSTLTNVSIYTVYCLAINALRTVISNIGNSYQSALGKYIAQDNTENTKNHFSTFCTGVWSVSTVVFTTCLLLIVPFVKLYVGNVTDANYYQPLFAGVIILANYIYCIREPYRLLILSAGKFKETNTGAIIEAVLNIVISICLINRLGLVGVAIGTLCAMLYRMIYFILYLRKDIIYINYRDLLMPFIKLSMILGINYIIFFNVTFNINSIFTLLIYAIVVFLAECLLTSGVFVGPKTSIKMLRQFLGGK